MDMANGRRVQRPWHNWDETRLRRNLGLYVHVPFCLARCAYCDFLTYGGDRPPELTPDAYRTALLSEIERRGAWTRELYAPRGRLVDTVFIGGGTPTFLEPQSLVEVLEALRAHFPFASDEVEFTVEANPDTLSPGYIAALARAGVNRLSIGVQATQPRHLRFLTRTHRWDDVMPVLASLRGGPIAEFSFDVIYGIPRLTRRELLETLSRLLALGPGHISAYELTVEPGTPYARWAARHPAQLASERRVINQQQTVGRLLASHGLYRYEVSNYAVPGRECRHNLRYWRGGDYLGLGLGAASRVGSEVINNAREFNAYKGRVNRIGTPDDPVQTAATALNAARGIGAADGAGAVNGAGAADGAGTMNAVGDCAPLADAFLRLRTRAGLCPPPSAIPPHWLSNGLVKLDTTAPNGRRMEVTANGLNYADLLARELV
jgi:oxygen-independent coproporphyrinogen-3 oxidase